MIKRHVSDLLANGSVSKHLQPARGVFTRRRIAMIEALDSTSVFRPLKDTGGSLSMIATLQVADTVNQLVMAVSAAQSMDLIVDSGLR